jgi:hypothetical protein
MILAINQAEGKKIQDGLILYKPCDEIAVCDSLLTGEQTDQDKYSYKLLEAYIEAEKRILLIQLRSQQIISIISDLSKVNRLEDTLQGNVTQGTVDITRLRLRIAQETKANNGELFWWYFVVIKYEEHVYSTDFVAVHKPEIEKMVTPTIDFHGDFKFDNLKSDFCLSIEVFGLYAVNNDISE